MTKQIVKQFTFASIFISNLPYCSRIKKLRLKTDNEDLYVASFYVYPAYFKVEADFRTSTLTCHTSDNHFSTSSVDELIAYLEKTIASIPEPVRPENRPDQRHFDTRKADLEEVNKIKQLFNENDSIAANHKHYTREGGFVGERAYYTICSRLGLQSIKQTLKQETPEVEYVRQSSWKGEEEFEIIKQTFNQKATYDTNYRMYLAAGGRVSFRTFTTYIGKIKRGEEWSDGRGYHEWYDDETIRKCWDPSMNRSKNFQKYLKEVGKMSKDTYYIHVKRMIEKGEITCPR